MNVLRSRVLRITAIANKIRGPVAFVITEYDCTIMMIITRTVE
jgi:hypothetical protein